MEKINFLVISDLHGNTEVLDKLYDEFKNADEFQEILSEYITLDSVIDAVKRAESLVLKNEDEQKVKEEYKGAFFYRDNPDVSVHEVVKMIFEVCGVK